MSKTITMQTHHILIIALVIIALIFLTRQLSDGLPPKNEEKPDTSGAWIQDGVVVPFDPDLKRFLAARKVEKVALIDEVAKIKVVDINGRDIEFCGRIVRGTEVKDLKGKKCHLEEITHINQFLIFRIEGGNPHPGTCGSSGGNVGC